MHLTFGAHRTYLRPMNDTLSAEQIEVMAWHAELTISDMCKRAGIAPSTWWRWRRGKTEPTLGVYRRIVAAVVDAEKRR